MALDKKTVRDAELKGKRVLIRVDYNVPLDENCEITDDNRITASLPTLDYCLEKGASLILMSHLGRPKDKPEDKYRLKPVAKRLGDLLGREVIMAPDCIGPEVEKICKGLKPGQVVLLENLRFHKGEKENDPTFAKALAGLGNVYVDDAFGTCHNNDASIVGVPKILKPAVSGFLVEKEIEFLGNKVVNDPKRPFMAILGGAKISSKIGVIESLLDKVDVLMIGGGMAYTFIKALGGKIGKSLLEADQVELAKKTMETAKAKGTEFILPLDHVIAREAKEGTETKVVLQGEIPDDWEALDIGPATIKKFKEVSAKAGTIFWNGPLGLFEIPTFAKGTFEIAKFLARSKAVTVIGGGDSASAVKASGVAEKMSHISTGGGASMEFVEKGILPGVEALDNR
jgi:phosphoglycerate kinase